MEYTPVDYNYRQLIQCVLYIYECHYTTPHINIYTHGLHFITSIAVIKHILTGSEMTNGNIHDVQCQTEEPDDRANLTNIKINISSRYHTKVILLYYCYYY